MRYKAIILSALLIVSCMPYIVTEKNVKKTNGYGHGHKNLSVYSSKDFDKKYTKMAQIRIRHDVIHGNLIYDDKMKNFLLQAINDYNGCALINDENLSDKTYYYLDIVSLHSDCEVENLPSPKLSIELESDDEQ